VTFGIAVSYLIPLAILIAIAFAVFAVLTAISHRNTTMQQRVERMTRPLASSSSFELPDSRGIPRQENMKTFNDALGNLGKALKPKTEQESNEIKMRLAHAGFRSEAAPGIYLGICLASLVLFALIGCSICIPRYGMNMTALQYIVVFVGFGFYLPGIVLWFLVSQRKQEIFLSLPDALDLLVVCVESGLGLDAAMRRVSEEMKDHAKIISEELQLANFQLQMGRPRRDVLHDLGVRTGVDDVRSLAAILIQADRFGSSIAQALRVQSDSMRVKRRQLAEEKAAKTAVQLIFPLVLFIFPGIFVVLVGPAAIKIMDTLLKK
jgi:tight adherence protein C